MNEPLTDAMLRTPATGLQVHYRDWGGPRDVAGATGDAVLPPVVLLHGLASTCRIYDLCAPLLARGRRVVAYDQRGHGETAKPDDGYDMATLVADGVGVVQALDLPSPYIVVGHSWGATVALEWAIRCPDEVRAAVLVDGGVSSFRDIPGATWATVEDRFGPPAWDNVRFDELLEHTRHGDLAFLDDGFRRAFFAAMTERRPDSTGAIRGRLSPQHHWSILRALWDDDLDLAYPLLRRPALALLALPREPWDEAQRGMAENKRRMAAHRQTLQPLLRVRWLEDTIHDIPLQRPEALAEAIAGIS